MNFQIKKYQQDYSLYSINHFTNYHTSSVTVTKISIEYKGLVNVQYSFHQVCMNDFVSDDWINYLALSYVDLDVSYDDFR